ncbi:MAG: hypothetical protein WA405_06805 [Candidatus Acidiferrales bacterium]
MMLSFLIWRVGILLEGLLLFCGFRSKTLARYPFFFIYIACALADDIVEYVHFYLLGWASYVKWFWFGEFLTLIVGCGIILEIFRCVLSAYPGAERFARIGGLAVFGAVACFAAIYPHMMPAASRPGTMYELGRDLRTVQAIFLVGLFGVIRYYGIAIGKNMRGIILGYGLYVGAELVGLAIRSYSGVPLPGTWNVIMQQAAYGTAVVIWITALWSYHPNPVPDSSIRLEEDYEAFAARTRSMVGALRIHLAKAARP